MGGRQACYDGEKFKKSPIAFPEDGPAGQRLGYHHNDEYKLIGEFSGQRVYDPNSNQILPEFTLRDYQLLLRNPGFLFHPDQCFKRITDPPRQKY